MGALVLATTLGFVQAGSAAPVNGGSVDLGLRGTLTFGTPEAPGAGMDASLVQRGPVTAAVDSDGAFVTSGAVSLGTDERPFHLGPMQELRVFAPQGFTGQIDPNAGTLAMAGEVVYSFAGGAFDCTTEPSHLTLSATGYDAGSGTATLVADPATFSVPRTARGTPACSDSYAQFIDDNLRLPTAPGIAALVLDVTLTPPVTATTPPTTTPPTTPPPPETTPPATPAPTSPAGPVPPGVGPDSVAFSTPSSVAAPANRSASRSTRSTVSSRPSSKPASPPSSATDTSNSTTTTTGYVWRGGAGPDLGMGPGPEERDVSADTRTGEGLRPRAAAEVSEDSDARFGIGVIVLIIGGALGGLFFFRAEARRLFRRRQRAAF